MVKAAFVLLALASSALGRGLQLRGTGAEAPWSSSVAPTSTSVHSKPIRTSKASPSKASPSYSPSSWVSPVPSGTAPQPEETITYTTTYTTTTCPGMLELSHQSITCDPCS